MRTEQLQTALRDKVTLPPTAFSRGTALRSAEHGVAVARGHEMHDDD